MRVEVSFWPWSVAELSDAIVQLEMVRTAKPAAKIDRNLIFITPGLAKYDLKSNLTQGAELVNLGVV